MFLSCEQIKNDYADAPVHPDRRSSLFPGKLETLRARGRACPLPCGRGWRIGAKRAGNSTHSVIPAKAGTQLRPIHRHALRQPATRVTAAQIARMDDKFHRRSGSLLSQG